VSGEELERQASGETGYVRRREACPWCGGLALVGTTCPKGIECPRCGVPAGDSCRRPSGHRADVLHAARVALAEERDRRAALEALDRLSGAADDDTAPDAL